MLIVDAGPLIAAGVTNDPDHTACRSALRDADHPIVVPQTVVVETAYFLRTRVGPRAEATFTRSIRDGELMAEPVQEHDWDRIAELVESYIDLPLGLVDASVVAIAERLGQTRIASLDHRHLGVVRPRHCERLELVP